MVASKFGWKKCLSVPDIVRPLFFSLWDNLKFRHASVQCKLKRVEFKVKRRAANRNNLPERPTNAQPQMILQNQPMKRKTMVDNCISPTKQLTHKTEVRFMSDISWRVRKNAITPDITVPARKRKKWHYMLDKGKSIVHFEPVIWSFLHSEEIQIGRFTRSSSSTQPMVSVFSFSKQCRWRFVGLFAFLFSEKWFVPGWECDISLVCLLRCSREFGGGI